MEKHRMGRGCLALTLALCMGVGLSGCGGQAAPPESYAVGEDTLPALGTVGTDEGWSASVAEETGEEGDTSYVYTGLPASGAETVKEYVDALMSDYACSVIDGEGVVQETPDFTEATGDVLVGKDTSAQNGILEVDLQWTEDSCTVSVSVQEGGQVTQPPEEESLTMEEAVGQMEGYSPSQLGLPGTSMADYLVCAQDGYVMADDQACFCLNVYDKATHSIQGSYLLTLDGERLYRLDRDTNQIWELTDA